MSEKAAREDQEDAAAAGEEEPAAAPATSEAQHLRRLQTDNRLLNEASSAPIACAQRERERESEREREGERERVTSAKRRMRACLLAARNKKAHTNGMPARIRRRMPLTRLSHPQRTCKCVYSMRQAAGACGKARAVKPLY